MTCRSMWYVCIMLHLQQHLIHRQIWHLLFTLYR